MPRRRRAVVREVLPDPVYNSTLVEKFVNSMMWQGKKNTAQGIFYEAMDKLRDRTSDDPLKAFDAWNELWLGAAAAHDRFLTVQTTRSLGERGWSITWRIAPR